MKNYIVHTIVNRPGAVLISFFVAIIFSVLMTGLLKFEQDIFTVLPRHNRTVKALLHALQSSDAQNRLYVLVRGNGEAQRLIDAGKALAESLRGMRVKDTAAFAHVTLLKNEAVGSREFKDLLALYYEKPECFIAASDLQRLKALLTSNDQLEQELKKSLAMLAAPGSAQLAPIITHDPFNLRQFLLEKMQALLQGMSFAPGPYLLSPDGHALLIMATPSDAAMNHAVAVGLLEKIEALRSAYPGLQIGITGGYAAAAQQEALVKTDMISCLWSSALAIAVLFLIVYRNLIVMIFIALPLGAGLQLALGVMALVWDKIHMLALAFASVVLGLGIDFTIHIYDRYVTERQAGRTVQEAVEMSVFRTGSAVFACCATTIGTFFVLVVTDNPLINQIGLLVTLGLSFCLITTLWALPAWLVWLEKHSYKGLWRPMPQLGMDMLGRWTHNRPGMVLLVSGLCLLAALAGSYRLGFEEDLLSLRPKGLDVFEVQQDLVRAFGNGQEYVMIAWPAENPQALWSQSSVLDVKLAGLQQRDLITSFISLTRIASPMPVHVVGIDQAGARGLFEKYGLRPDDFPAALQFLKQAAAEKPKEYRQAPALEHLPRMLQRFFISDSDGILGVSWVQIPENADVAELQQELAQSFPGCLVINQRLAGRNIGGEVHHQFWVTLGFSWVLTLVIVAFFYRRLSSFMLVLLPLCCGLAATAGIMGLSGMHINLFNYIVLPILIGAGVDYGIIVFCRYEESKDVRLTVGETGRPVLMTVLTTVLGFGSLSLANYHVLSGMGTMVTVGILACFFFAMTALPAALRLREKIKTPTA